MTARCRCRWDRYDRSCPHPFHQAVALRETPTRLVTSVILSTPCPDTVPTEWSRS